MGCGDGAAIEYLINYNYHLYGYDLEFQKNDLRKKLKRYFGEDFESHIKITPDGKKIPFPEDFFDVIYANQVFEHIKYLDTVFAEIERVLKPNGVLLTNFPLVTYPIEGHLKIPFAHWIPPGKIRIQYLRMFYASRLRSKLKGMNAIETAAHWDEYLQKKLIIAS